MSKKRDGEDMSGAGILKKLRECLNLPWIDCFKQAATFNDY